MDVANTLRMLSAYLTATATIKPPNAYKNSISIKQEENDCYNKLYHSKTYELVVCLKMLPV